VFASLIFSDGRDLRVVSQIPRGSTRLKRSRVPKFTRDRLNLGTHKWRGKTVLRRYGFRYPLMRPPITCLT
jgi:hypothetical protein